MQICLCVCIYISVCVCIYIYNTHTNTPYPTLERKSPCSVIVLGIYLNISKSFQQKIFLYSPLILQDILYHNFAFCDSYTSNISKHRPRKSQGVKSSHCSFVAII